MNNLCSIFYNKHQILKNLTGSAAKTELLDKCIYWWQISKYQLKNSPYTWFTRPYEEIAKDLGISLSSVNRWLKSFEEDHLIERRTCLSSTNKDGEYTVIKRTYIRITEKLIAIIKTKEQKTNECTEKQQKDTMNNVIEKLSIYKDKDYNLFNNNTVSEDPIVNNLNSTKNPVKPLVSETSTNTESQLPIEQHIGERIDSQLKNYIKGALKNLQTQHGLQFSNPDQIFAEMVFSVLNPKDQLTGIENTHHRVNIIAKLMREKRWTTPKGFYNHWDIGNLFKKRQKTKEAHYEAEKQRDMQSTLSITDNGEVVIHVPRTLYPTKPLVDYSEQKEVRAQQQQLQELNQAIAGEMRYLEQMKKYYGHDEHPVVMTIRSKLEHYTNEQAKLKASLAELKAA